ncbi:hypothetical protein JCM10908_002132 [Rhodotorula pacifica]|uniref:uncharacterized protein n=1 Tax=Rhodotorula pacifica TaxID=1495444 RepID=UPI0031746976
MAPSGGGKALNDELGRRLESLRRQGHLDPVPTFETRVDYPPSAPHPTGIPYACVAPESCNLRQFRQLVRTEPPLPPETAPECCQDPSSICTEFRDVALNGDEAAFEAFFGPLNVDVMILDMTQTGKDGRAMYTETVDLGSDFVADWDDENKRYKPVSAKNPHLHALRPGHSLIVVDKSNLAHFECKGGQFTGASMARIRRSTSPDDYAHKAAAVMLEAVPELRSVGAIKDFEICAAPVGDPDGAPFTRRANFFETIAVLNVGGNEKGCNSHTVGPTRIDMANASIVQPPPLWRIEDANILRRLHDSLPRARAIYAQLQDRHRVMTALRGRISLAIVRLLLPPRVFSILEDRATTCQLNILPLNSRLAAVAAAARSQPSATPELPEPPPEFSSSAAAPPLVATGESPPRDATPLCPPPRRADDARIIGIAQGLGDFFGRLHLDDRDDYALFSMLIPEGLLPRGSTLGAFLLAEYGAVFDLLSYDLDSGEDDWTVAAISGDSLHVGSDVQLAPPALNDQLGANVDPVLVPESDELFRVVSVNYPTYAGTAAPPTIPITPGATLTDPSIYRANVPAVVMTHDGLGSAIWGDPDCGRVVIAQVAARESLWRHIRSWLDTHHNIAHGAPKQLSMEQFSLFSLSVREAVWAAAKSVEDEWQISWQSEWTREARRLGVPSDSIQAFARKPNPFGAHDSRDETNWRARLRAVEHFAIRARATRNKIRGWTETSAAFKERSGNRLDVRTRKYHDDPSAARLPAAPPSLYFPLLSTPLAPSHLAAAGIAVRTVTLDSFPPSFVEQHRISKERDRAAWDAEAALVAPYIAAHKSGIAAAEQRWVDFYRITDCARHELPASNAAVPSPPLATDAAVSNESSGGDQIEEVRPLRVTWHWRDAAGRPIDANGNIYLDLVAEKDSLTAADGELPLVNSAPQSATQLADCRAAVGALPALATSSERPKRNAAQAGLDAAKGSSPHLDGGGSVKRARSTAKSGSTKSSLSSGGLPLVESKSLARLVDSREPLETPGEDLIADRFVSAFEASIASVARWQIRLDDPTAPYWARDTLSSASSVMQALIPSVGEPGRIEPFTEALRALGALKESSSMVDSIVHTMWYNVLHGLARQVEISLWPAAVDGAKRIQQFGGATAETGASALTPREIAVQQYVYLTADAFSFTSANGKFKWAIEKAGRPFVRRKDGTPARRGASRQVRDDAETYVLAYALLDLAILDIFSLPSLNSRDGPSATTTVSVPHILTATGPVAQITSRFLRHVHRTLALISTFVSSTGSTAVLLLPAVHSAIERPADFCRSSRKEPSTASAVMAMVVEWGDALPAILTPTRCSNLTATLDILRTPLATLGLSSDAVDSGTGQASYYPCNAQAVTAYENALDGSSTSNDSDDDDVDRDPTYVPIEHLRHLEFLSRLAARRAAAGRDLLRFDLKTLDADIVAMRKKISRAENEVARLSRDRELFASPERNLSWLSVVFCEMLFFGFELHPTTFPVNPFDSPSLLELHTALGGTPEGRELQQAILHLARANGLDWALWLKQGHEVELFAPANLTPLTAGDSFEERRRRAFTVFCIRGIIVGSTPTVYRAMPARGWLNRSEFLAWLARADVSVMRARNSGPERLWTNGTPYGSWTDLDEFHVWNYDLHVGAFLEKLDTLAAEASTERPPYSAVVSLLRGWEVPKTLIAERGLTYDQRRADRSRSGKQGSAQSHESKENKEKKASKAKSTEPALPILGGALSSLHVASDLVRYGLVEPASDEEMGVLLDGMKDLGASRGLAELGFVRKRASKVVSTDEHGAEQSTLLPRTTTAEAFARFGRLFRSSLAQDILELFGAVAITLTATLLENLCCKFSRGPWARLRLDDRFRRLLDSLPAIFTTSDREWELRGDDAGLAQLEQTIAAKEEVLEGFYVALNRMAATVKDLEQGGHATTK